KPITRPPNGVFLKNYILYLQLCQLVASSLYSTPIMWRHTINQRYISDSDYFLAMDNKMQQKTE
ncbi:hypothetical protein, partial [Salmonella enterica]|uniref:hypothetical protein n=1 Tax=Salmonella enterica TaxID=28901 RepID=UPI003298B7DD